MKTKTRRNQPHVLLNARKFILFSMWHSTAQAGSIIRKMVEDLDARRFDAVAALPFIDRVVRAEAKRPHIPLEVRRRVVAPGLCAQCSATTDLVVDHIVPFSRGGAHAEENFQCLCQPCNLRKSDRLEVAK